MIPPCIINPKTGKPFLRHSYDSRPSVSTYYGSMATGFHPATYRVTHTCRRCGYRAKDTTY